MDLDLRHIEVRPFSSSLHTTFLMEINGHFFEIGKDSAELLNYLKEHGCSDASIEAYVERHEGQFSKDNVNAFLKMLALKLEEKKDGTNPRSTFLYKYDLISSEKVRWLSSPLRILFNSYVLILVSCVFVVIDFFYFVKFYSNNTHIYLNIYIIIGLFIFFILSSLMHELGHASACHYFQIPHGNIGLGLYLNIPVFYTDVSQVWKLPRKDRFIVNLGGVYFQLFLLIPFLIADFFCHYPFFKYIIVVMNMNFVITLNPFFKFDGYWILSDILGIANLRKKGTEWIGYMWDKIRNKKGMDRPYLFLLSKSAKFGLVIYTVIVNLFFGFYFFYILPMFFVQFYETFPDRFVRLIRELTYRQTPDWNNFQQIVLQLIFLLLAIYMVYRIVYSFYRKMCERKTL